MAEYKSTSITLGYGGSAFINVNGGKASEEEEGLCWVFMQSGNISKSIDVPHFLSYDMNLDFNYETTNIRNDVALGVGLNNFQGNLNFAITQGALNKLFNKKFINRNNVFDVYINDGRKDLELKCCYWTNFSIIGNPRQVLIGSIDFISTNDQKNDFDIIDDGTLKSKNNSIIVENDTDDGFDIEFEPQRSWANRNIYYGFDEKIIEYWNTGSEGLESFRLNFTREATPVYLNTSSNNPTYIRVGKINLSGQFSSWKDWYNTKEVRIADKKLSFYGLRSRNSSSFSYEGIDNTGQHNYSINLYNITDSSKLSWDITNLGDSKND